MKCMTALLIIINNYSRLWWKIYTESFPQWCVGHCEHCLPEVCVHFLGLLCCEYWLCLCQLRGAWSQQLFFTFWLEFPPKSKWNNESLWRSNARPWFVSQPSESEERVYADWTVMKDEVTQCGHTDN